MFAVAAEGQGIVDAVVVGDEAVVIVVIVIIVHRGGDSRGRSTSRTASLGERGRRPISRRGTG